MPFTDVQSGDEVLAEHIDEIQGSLTGASGQGVQVLLTDYASTTNYNTTIKNPTTNGLALDVQASDGAHLATLNDAGVTLKSKDGTRIVAITNSSVAVTAPSGTFTVNGQAIGAGFAVYNVLDYGIVQGSTSANASANSTAFATLWNTVAANGGGTIFFPPGRYPFTTTTLNHTQAFAMAINVVGAGWTSLIDFYNTTGFGWDIASTEPAGTSQISRGHFKHLAFQNRADATSGVDLRLGAVTNYLFENIFILGSVGQAAFGCVQIGKGALACNNLIFRSCFFICADKANASVFSFPGTATVYGGLTIDNCSLQTTSGIGTSAYILFFVNTALFDSMWIHHSGIASALKGIYVAEGWVENVIIDGCFFDGTSGNNIDVASTTGRRASTWQIQGNWFSSEANNILVAPGTGAANAWQVIGNYFTNNVSASSSVLFASGCNYVQFIGNIVGANMSGAGPVVDFINVDGLVVTGNIVDSGGSGTNSIKIDSNCEAVVLANNVSIGDDVSFGGATSASRVNANNAYIAVLP